MKNLIVFLFLCSFLTTRAQKIDSIYVDLYTDSLKKGTFNYINIDGKLSSGRYLPLDTSYLIYSASAGKFVGNCLWIDKEFKDDKVNVKVVLKKNSSVFKQFDIYVKTNPDNENLKTTNEIMGEANGNKKSKKKNR